MKFNLRTFLMQSAASIFIAFAIWLIAKQSNMDTTWVPGSIVISNLPPNLVVDTNPDEVLINVQYPRELSNRIVGKTLQIKINARDFFSDDPRQWTTPLQPSLKQYTLNPKDVNRHLLTQSAQVLAVDPPAVTLAGRLLARVIPIEVRTTNSLAPNLELTGPLKSDPAQIAVTGAREDLERAGRAVTTPIDLSQITASQQAFPRLILPPGVRLMAADNPQLTVDIGVSEKSVRQTISGVPINYLSFSGLIARVTPPTADVLIEGPASAVNTISPDDISFTPARDLPELPNKSYEVGIEAHLKASVPAEIASQITVHECNPPRITVEFSSPDSQNGGGGKP